MDQLDPDRPWISDPNDLPSRLDWFRVFLDPLGQTSRLHFTRAWTLLFFIRVAVFAVPPFIVLIFGLAGAENPDSAGLPPWGFPLAVIVTAMMSYILHRRRLLNAERTGLWAYLVLVPMIFGAAGFYSGLQQGAKEYDVAVQAKMLRDQNMDPRQIALDFERPDVLDTLARTIVLELVRYEIREGRRGESAIDAGYKAALSRNAVTGILEQEGLTLRSSQRMKLDEMLRDAVDAREKNGRGWNDFLTETDNNSMSGYGQTVRRQWRGLLPDIDLEKVSERSHAFEMGIQMSMAFWALPSLFVMLWSLLWVGRLPNPSTGV
ncbi:MAG: hypothetical protein AAFY34_16005 [Pseudomonadota bacterium]